MKILDRLFRRKEMKRELPLYAIPGWGSVMGGEVNNAIKPEDLTPLVTFDNLPSDIMAEGKSNFSQWRNSIANINSNNSISQHSEYVLGRISYQECASLSTDTLISKAITTIVNEMFKEGGEWDCKGADENFIASFHEETKRLEVEKIVKSACRKALEYGGAFIYIDTADEDLSSPLFLSKYTSSDRRLRGFTVLEAWQLAPVEVNTWNPLSRDYMRPTRWFVMGAGQNVHYTRLIPITFFDVVDLLKPIFNYLGLPLSFYMKSFVASAEVSRQCIADLLLRFRTDYIKTTNNKIMDRDTLDRIKFNNRNRNNFGTYLLSDNEEVQQINTPLGGLDNILSQMYELVTMTTGMPVTKFLGLSPRGFNATGEHDQNNYYDLIAGYQTNIAEPALERIGHAITVLRLNSYFQPDYTFNPLNRLTKSEEANLRNQNADYISKLEQAGVISSDDMLRAIKENDFSFSWVTDVPEQEENDNEFMQEEEQAGVETGDDGDKIDDPEFATGENGKVFAYNPNTHETSGLGKEIDGENREENQKANVSKNNESGNKNVKKASLTQLKEAVKLEKGQQPGKVDDSQIPQKDKEDPDNEYHANKAAADIVAKETGMNLKLVKAPGTGKSADLVEYRKESDGSIKEIKWEVKTVGKNKGPDFVATYKTIDKLFCTDKALSRANTQADNVILHIVCKISTEDLLEGVRHRLNYSTKLKEVMIIKENKVYRYAREELADK